jgi:hypothetical protein
VGIGDRVAELRGAAEASGWSGQPGPEHQAPQLPESDDHFPSNLASPGGRPTRGDSALNERFRAGVLAVARVMHGAHISHSGAQLIGRGSEVARDTG